MFDQIEKAMDTMYPVKKVSVILPEELAASYEKCLADLLAFNDGLKCSSDNKRERFCQLVSEANQKFISIQQFIVGRYAPDEYKQLADPRNPRYSPELRKMTFTIAENETLELRKNLFANALAGSIKMVADKLGKGKINEK